MASFRSRSSLVVLVACAGLAFAVRSSSESAHGETDPPAAQGPTTAAAFIAAEAPTAEVAFIAADAAAAAEAPTVEVAFVAVETAEPPAPELAFIAAVDAPATPAAFVAGPVPEPTDAIESRADALVAFETPAFERPGLCVGPAVAFAPQPPCPPEMAQLGKYCIDRWEAHLVTRAPGGGTMPHPHYERPADGAWYAARSEAGAFPQAYISRVEAAAACANAGKRLCSMNEWRGACGGEKRSDYPYGRGFRAGACSSGKPHLLTRVGPNPKKWTYELFNDPKLDQEPGFLDRAGDNEECTTPQGVSDLVGNLHEWVSDRVDERLMVRLSKDGGKRRKQSWRRGNGVFLGGFFSTSTELGQGCLYVTVAHEPRYHDYSTGFRCCADAR